MTESQARTAASVILGVAAAGAAFYVLRNPPLRRAVLRLAGQTITRSLPLWFTGEVMRAWEESGRERREAARMA